MRPSTLALLSLLAPACARSTPAPAHAHPSDAPAPVVAKVAALLGADATIEVEGPADRRVYEGEATTKLSIELDATGGLMTTEVALPTASLPAAVAATAAARGRITEVELVVTATGVVFEVEVAGPGGAVELLIDPAGAVVGDQPAQDDDDGDRD